MPRYVAFLRAINTPPRWVKMERLRSAFRGAGYSEVSTYIASGNVIFASDDQPNVGLLEAEIEEACGFYSKAFLRTGAEVRSVVERVPWPDQQDQTEVAFLERAPNPVDARSLEAAVPGAARLDGRELFLLRPDPGLQVNIDRHLQMSTTRRGFRTVQQIAERFLTP